MYTAPVWQRQATGDFFASRKIRVMEQEGRIGGASMTISEPSTRALREAIAALEPNRWLRDDIIEALDEASKAVSIVSFYQRYFNRLILAFDNPEDAELVDFLSSRM